MRTRLSTLGVVIAGATLVIFGGCGGSDQEGSQGEDGSAESAQTSAESTQTSAESTRTVEIEMRDIAFEPSAVTVKAGETVQFVFRNVGEAVHDAFIGDGEAQAEHATEMQKGDGMHHGDDAHGVTVQPGETASLTHTFEEGESLLIGCHQPGHYAAGMKVTVAVA